jgi:hypothetical protein
VQYLAAAAQLMQSVKTLHFLGRNANRCCVLRSESNIATEVALLCLSFNALYNINCGAITIHISLSTAALHELFQKISIHDSISQ